MNELTPEQIQERFNKLPAELQSVLQSEEILNKLRGIGADEDLHIDQIGDLVDQVVLILLGFAKSSNFVSDTSVRLSIDADKTRRIAEKINKEVFESIKQHMINQDKPEDLPAKAPHITALERAGDFEIIQDRTKNGEPVPASTSVRNIPLKTPVRPMLQRDMDKPIAPTPPISTIPFSREPVLKPVTESLVTSPILETETNPPKPEPIAEPVSNPVPDLIPQHISDPVTEYTPISIHKPIPQPVSEPVSEPVAEPDIETKPRESLAEQLMRTPTAIPHEKVVRKQGSSDTGQPIPTKPTGSDPYREPTN